MKTTHNAWRGVATALFALLVSNGIQAADACATYKWDVAREIQLYRTSPSAISVGIDGAMAPAMEPGKLYTLTLQEQEKVRYLLPSSKKMLADGAFGGLLKLRVDRAGTYRLAADSGYWLDVVLEGKQLPTLDFNGVTACDGPRKIVVFELPAGVDLFVQVSGASAPQAKLTVTPVAQSAP